MDEHTLELLEYNKVRELLASYSACSLGKELARQQEPSTDLAWVRAEMALVSEMGEALDMGQSPPLGGLHDVRLLIRRAAIGSMLSAEQLLEVADTLTCTGNIYRYRMRLSERFEKLAEMLAPVEDLGPVAKVVTSCIDSRGHVLDLASRELGQVRRKLANLEDRVQAQIRRLLRDPELRKILRYPNATVSGDHYLLPVAINHRQKVQGVVHRTSSTGETVFIEPSSLASLSNERAVIRGEEDREIRRILRRLSTEVGRHARPLAFAIDILARLDLITAKARFSRDYNMDAPDINTTGQLWLRQARHPLLEYLFREERKVIRKSIRSSEPPNGESSSKGPSEPEQKPSKSSPADKSSPIPDSQEKPSESRSVVPIDIRLGFGFNMLIITGPNTGGKTVCLKTAGLLALMAQSGMHIPAGQGSQVPIFHDVLADIGDEQSLEQSLSTFSSHISRISHIFKVANKNSLVLLDELGAGTDPTEGAALGRAILDQLDRIGCRAMVTTHLGDLKTYAFNNDRAENGAVEFNTETLRPTYKLQIGQFGQSCALQIARRLKLPRNLLNRAHRYLRRRQKRAPEMAQLQRLRQDAEQAREEALRAQHEATQKAEELRQQAARMEREAQEAEALRQARLKLQPNDKVRVPKYDKTGQVIRVDHRRNLAVVSLGIAQWEVSLEDVFPEGK